MDASLALIAHDGRQLDMVQFAVRHVRLLRRCALVATEATGKLLEDEVGLRVERLQAAPVAARVAMARSMPSSFWSTPGARTATSQTSEPCSGSATCAMCPSPPTWAAPTC